MRILDLPPHLDEILGKHGLQKTFAKQKRQLAASLSSYRDTGTKAFENILFQDHAEMARPFLYKKWSR